MSSNTKPPITEAECRTRNDKLGRRMRWLWWPARRLELAAENFALGQACRHIGCTGLAVECFQRVRILLPSKYPDQSKTALESLALLAASHNHMGMVLLDEGRPDDARPEFEEAVRIRSKLREWFPEERENEVYLGGALCNLGHSLADSDPDLATLYYGQSLSVLRHPTQRCECSYWDESRHSWWCEQLESLGDALGLQWVALAPAFVDNAQQGLASLQPAPRTGIGR